MGIYQHSWEPNEDRGATSSEITWHESAQRNSGFYALSICYYKFVVVMCLLKINELVSVFYYRYDVYMKLMKWISGILFHTPGTWDALVNSWLNS